MSGNRPAVSGLLRIGDTVPRYEDARLLTGRGRYTGDLRLPGEAHLAAVRSPHASARIVSIDTTAALAMPGVLCVLTGRDLGALGTFPSRIRRNGADGKPMFEPPRRVLPIEAVRHVGEAVAVVVAETPALARDAAERVEVEYAALPAAASIEAAVCAGAPAVWPEVADNLAFVYTAGDRAGVEAAFACAAHRVRLQTRINRITANAIEPRCALADCEPAGGRLTLYVSVQTPHGLRNDLCTRIFGMPASRLRVVAPDVGGGFGMKSGDYPEYALVLWCARLLGRPVRWTADRSESFLADHQARDNLWDLELALDAGHRFLAVRARSQANLGAYLAYAGTHQATTNVGCLAGVYATPAMHIEVRGIYTHTHCVSPYRGAGRPEALYAMERLIDQAACELGVDRIELRRRNLVRAEQMPWKTALTFTYDSGDFPGAFERVLTISGWAGFEARRTAAAARGRLRGIGFAFAIEIAGGPIDRPFEEYAEVRIDPTGSMLLAIGTHNHGQGHETSLRQIASETLGLEGERIEIVYGDTDLVAHGRGTFGSRSMSSGGAALLAASAKVEAKAMRIAAHLLEAAAGDIERRGQGWFVAGTDRGVSWDQVAAAAYATAQLPADIEPGLYASATVCTDAPTFPNSAHVCEVELDPETGCVSLQGYWVVDDVGRVVNPALLYGQIHGGVAQGLGQVLMENIAYDAEGQLLTGSFMDYAMPRAEDLIDFEVESRPVPTRANPLGVKGAGEAGTVGALPAAVNAILDALRPCGIAHLDMPLTPEKLWRAMQSTPIQPVPSPRSVP